MSLIVLGGISKLLGAMMSNFGVAIFWGYISNFGMALVILEGRL